MKRSVSPQSTPQGPPKKAKSGLGFFSVIKKALFKDSALPSRNPQDEINIDITDEISNTFIGRKQSTHSSNSFSRVPSSAVPRASVSGSSRKLGYGSLLNTFSHESAEPKISTESELEREVSPSVYLPRNSILPLNPEEMELEAPNEPEYDSLYRDEEGNLVRPPFINLDPKERYQMLQMKKSVQASQALQDSLKYMVDPDETTSIIRPGNRVDTSTQTHNEDYLQKKLHFNAARKRLALANRANRKKSRALFSGDFSYDRSKIAETEQSSSKLHGYLGSVTKPKFESATEEQKSSAQSNLSKGHKTIAKPSSESSKLDQAYIDRTNKLSSLLRVKDAPTQMKPVGPSSGFNFEVSKDKFTTLPSESAKAETSTNGSTKATEKTKESTNALFAPPFDDGAQDERPAKKTRTRDETGESSAKAPAFSFGSKPIGDKSKSPNSSTTIGSKPVFKSADITSTDSPKPAFNFGSAAETKKPASSFSFGKSEPDKTSASSSQEPGSEKAKTPMFSFQKSEADKEKIPKFSFQNTATDNKESSTKTEADPVSTSDAKATTLPKFSFGTTAPEKNAPSSGESSSAGPKFSFSKSGASEDPAKSPAPSLFQPKAIDAKETKPAFSFNSTSKEDTENPKPAFSFGSKPASSGAAFSFGAKAPENEEAKEKPTPLFGTSQEPKDAKQSTPFSFNKVDTPVSADSASENAEKKTAFSFGNQTPISGEAKPSFSFGATTTGTKPLTPSTSATAPSFSFGKPAEAPASNNTSFSFGQTATADPASIFGNSNSSAPAPAFNFSVTPKATTPFSAPQGPTGGFNFSSGALGQGSRPTTPGAPGSATGGGFGNPGPNASNSSFGFGSAPTGFPAVSGAAGFGERARTVTPNATQFGSNQNQAPSGFGGNDGGFSFSNNAMLNNAFNSAPGSFGQPSRDSTPPAFGSSVAFPQASAPGQNLPPVTNVSGRRIAQMRQRKRF